MSAEDLAPREPVAMEEGADLLRFSTCGSVDDGKSTLIGRLLYDTKSIFEDQLQHVEDVSRRRGEDYTNLALLTDGLRAEREQGITIDVAYRYFATPRRKFIIADTPGHIQYTRNMVTGASLANLAIVLVDARKGMVEQSRRHSFLTALLRIPHLVFAVNKMDLVGWDEAVFRRIEAEFRDFTEKLGVKDSTFIPMSALLGDNVVRRSESTPYYDGPTLLEHLETVPIAADRNQDSFRYPVQTVLRPTLDYRGYAAQVASGVVRRGDAVVALPSKRTSRVVAIDTYEGEVDEAFAPMSVTVRLADEIDISRGDMLVREGDVPRATQEVDAMVVWLHERPLDRNKAYLLKHTTNVVRADVRDVAYAVDLEKLENVPAERLGLNDIGRATIRTHRPIYVDPYEVNRATGAFILIDSATNDTVAAGMILPSTGAGRAAEDGDPRRVDAQVASFVSALERRARLGHAGVALLLKASSAESLRAHALVVERVLFDRGLLAAVVLDAAAPAKVAKIEALAQAGVLAVSSFDVATSVSSSLGAARVLEIPLDGDDPETTARAALRALEAAGLLDG
jgi:sulfate adenylyltransferase large subunit